ncbi:hypothetical protein PR003_g13433 [Phytophthora rubi]|uniref:Uncharacterized protein n=1 Tax=Phytophthora rubi TaxID=129364 RepID=A0A6A4F5I2_9STRA|nr:hypothetical protein PR002_g12791 [Phytophthora rubi]KAE9025555.1 hypothetical protein PR001_g12394 [Phytophthora rubi]KAE9334623.1 hypothetical protein PR003_g13433 [Phytophthora rubi]
MDRRLGFLVPWCTALRDRIAYRVIVCENIAWDIERRHLQVYVPGRKDRLDRGEEEPPLQFITEAAYRAHFVKVQEALLLLAAVAHVDHTMVRFLLRQYCGVDFGHEEEEKFEEEILVQYVVHIDLDQVATEDGTFDSDLVQFCHLRHPSVEFQTALQKIAELDEHLQITAAPVEIRVPVRVHVSDRFHQPLAALTAAHKAEKRIFQENPKLQQLYEQGGPLQPTFKLDPMIVDLDCVAITTEMADTMDALIRDNLWFSRVTLNTDLDSETASVDDEAWKKAFAKLMTSTFGSTRRDRKLGASEYFSQEVEPPRTQIHALQLCYEGEGDFAAFPLMCSAIAVNQTVSKLTLELSIDPENETTSAQAWKWIAYAFFSKRARKFSALQSLGLIATASSITRADIAAFRRVVLSDHPEEELFGSPRGSVDSRDATLAKGASVRWYFDEITRPTVFRLQTFDSPVRFIRTCSDDGESEWVNVIIPGYGRCEAQREDLKFVAECTAGTVQPALTSLQLPSYSINAEFSDGLPLLLSTVSSTLKSLAVEGGDLNSIKSLFLEGFPRTVEGMSLRSRGVEARFDFKDYHSSQEQPPVMSSDWTDIGVFVKGLTDVTNPLRSCINRLRVRLNDIFYWRGEAEADEISETLLHVLECNETLEFLDVVAPPDFHVLAAAFRDFHLKPLPKPLQPLSIECKLAFLSVMTPTNPTQKRTCKSLRSGQPLCQLNEHVLSKIFAFAAPPVMRKVYFRKANEVDWDDEDTEVPL